MPAKKTSTTRKAAAKAPPKKEEPTVIERLLALRDEIENELDGRHSDLVTVGLSNCSRAIKLLADQLEVEQQLVRP